MYMDTQEIEIDTEKITNEAVERWIDYCLQQIRHKKQKQKEDENAKQN